MSEQPLRVVLVCRANVCRSPLAEATLRAAADEAAVPLEVTSAGTQPAVDGQRCAVATEQLILAGIATPPDAHVPRRLDAQQLEDTDLVLCADRGLCREAILLRPSVRSRTATFAEAEPLLLHAAQRIGRAADTGGLTAARAAISVMADSRVHVWSPLEPSAQDRRLLRRRRRHLPEPWDIADTHHESGSAAHRATADQVIQAMQRLVASLDTVMRPH